MLSLANECVCVLQCLLMCILLLVCPSLGPEGNYPVPAQNFPFDAAPKDTGMCVSVYVCVSGQSSRSSFCAGW